MHKMIAGILASVFFSSVFPAAAGNVLVRDTRELLQAFRQVMPGDNIVLEDGTYELGRTAIRRPGEKLKPVTVRALNQGKATIHSHAIELFVVMAPNWHFLNLDITCQPKNPNACHHAFHIVGPADNTVVGGNRMRDFHAAIKGNGNGKGRFPNDVLVTGNAIYNNAPRRTNQPVTLVDIIGGERWTVRENFIADFSKSGGDNISYGAFMKGGSQDGVFERNLVMCEWRHKGGVRVGLSFGGGGTGQRSCMNGRCNPEHNNGIMKNNVILNCPNDVAIYLNKAANTKIYNNIMYNTYGIDVRFPTSTAHIANNVITGGMRERNDGKIRAEFNVVSGSTASYYAQKSIDKANDNDTGKLIKRPLNSIANWVRELLLDTDFFTGNKSIRKIFRDPDNGDFELRSQDEIVDMGRDLVEVTHDFCGQPRKLPPPDIGAFEFGAAPCRLDARLEVVKRFESR